MKMTPQKWRLRIHRSLELQKPRRDEAARFKRAYTGDYTIEPRKKLDENKDEMAVNFVYTYVETVRPTILPGTPRAFAEGMDQDSELTERHYQAVINHYFRVCGLKNQLKLVLNDWFYSFAAFLTEWEYHEELQFDQETGKIPQFEEDENGDPVLDDETGEPVQSFRIIHDRPIMKRIDPFDVCLDIDSKCREEDRWRAYRVILTKQEFDQLPGVTPLMKKQVRGKTLPRELVRQPMNEDRHNSTERNWVVLWRIYDTEANMTYLMPDGESLDFFVEAKEWPWEFSVGDDRFPLTILEAKQDAENPYSFSCFKAYWAQIQERNKIRTMLQSNVRRQAPGWMGKKGIMDEEQKNKFVSSKIGEYIETNGDPSMILPKPTMKISTEFFQHDRIVGEDLTNVSSLDEYNSQDSIANTATEASIMDAKGQGRKNEAKNEFADFVAVIGGKVGQLAQQFLTAPLAIKIKAPDNPSALQWISVNGEQIQGEFHLTVKPGVDDREDEALFRQQTLKAGELLANNPWTDQKKLSIMLAKAIGKEPEDILKSDQQFQQDQANEQQQKTAEIDKKLALKAKETDDRPDIKFNPIDVAALHPTVQNMIIEAAMHQNKVAEIPAIQPTPGGGGAPGVSQIPAIGSGSPAAPSMANAGAPGSSMPSVPGLNQGPAPAGGGMPPPTVVQPFSEGQGGKK